MRIERLPDTGTDSDAEEHIAPVRAGPHEQQGECDAIERPQNAPAITESETVQPQIGRKKGQSQAERPDEPAKAPVWQLPQTGHSPC